MKWGNMLLIVIYSDCHLYFLFVGSQSTPKKCNMIDVNPESSFSGSNSNSMISKTPTPAGVDLPTDEFIDTNQAIDMEKVNNCLSVVPGCGKIKFNFKKCGSEINSSQNNGIL